MKLAARLERAFIRGSYFKHWSNLGNDGSARK
jgi:hypothetical protein